MSVYDIPGHDVWARAITNATVSSSSSSASSFSFNSSSYSVATFNSFVFSAARSSRSSIMILAIFNMVAAATTAVGILLDSWVRTRRGNQHLHFGRHGFQFVSLMEMFPLVISAGVLVQSAVFVGAQSLGLHGISVLGCTVTSQMMFPAIFIVPFLQSIFALNTAYLSFLPTPFPRRTKWNIPICLSIAIFLLFVIYLVALFVRPPNFCFASLYWFVLRWGLACFIITLVVTISLMVAAVLMFWKLRTIEGKNIGDEEEKMTAKTMVYYTVVAMLSNFLYLPFFFSIGVQGARFFSSTALQLSLLSSIVSNISAIINGLLHLYLRSRIISKIPPATIPNPSDIKYSPEKHDSFKRHIRVHTNDTDDSIPITNAGATVGARAEDDEKGYAYSKISKPPPTAGLKTSSSTDYLLDQTDIPMTARQTFDPLRSNTIYVMSNLPQEPEPARMSPPMKSYSPTSTASPASSPRENTSLLPTTTYGASVTPKKIGLPTTTYEGLPSTTYSSTASSSSLSRNSRAVSMSKDVPLIMSIPIQLAPSTSRNNSIALLAPPPYGNTIGKPRHTRNSSLGSLGSSATVQIGLRLSNADDVRLNSTYFKDQNKVYSISYENAAQGLQHQTKAFVPTNLTKKPSPLANNNSTIYLAPPSTISAESSQSPTSPAESSRSDDYSSLYFSSLSGVTGFSGFSGIPSFSIDELQPIPIGLASPSSPASQTSAKVEPLKLTMLNAAVYEPGKMEARRRSKSIEIGMMSERK